MQMSHKSANGSTNIKPNIGWTRLLERCAAKFSTTYANRRHSLALGIQARARISVAWLLPLSPSARSRHALLAEPAHGPVAQRPLARQQFRHAARPRLQ